MLTNLLEIPDKFHAANSRVVLRLGRDYNAVSTHHDVQHAGIKVWHTVNDDVIIAR